MTISYHKVITDVLTVLRCDIKCSGDVVSSIDSGCSDVVQDGQDFLWQSLMLRGSCTSELATGNLRRGWGGEQSGIKLG